MLTCRPFTIVKADLLYSSKKPDTLSFSYLLLLHNPLTNIVASVTTLLWFVTIPGWGWLPPQLLLFRFSYGAVVRYLRLGSWELHSFVWCLGRTGWIAGLSWGGWASSVVSFLVTTPWGASKRVARLLSLWLRTPQSAKARDMKISQARQCLVLLLLHATFESESQARPGSLWEENQLWSSTLILYRKKQRFRD